ncbi:helix-turn-helix transcriptional regulator [Agrobacterium tumefaciens]|uniref:helix-turn-helix transcriptional regulator n=1 Tax=Agrobacterium tumefaciens TaxID=358 RepID=UPI0015717E81|nr:helix-turn-helix transcriptional regulator [Agrobacterium tumefaciens]
MVFSVFVCLCGSEDKGLQRNEILPISALSARMCEAAFAPELWTPLLDDIARATQSGVGSIHIYWPKNRSVTTSFNDFKSFHDDWDWDEPVAKLATWMNFLRTSNYINTGFFHLDPNNGRWSNLPEFEKRIEWHRELGMGSQVSSIVEMFNGEVVTLDFIRSRRHDSFTPAQISELNALSSVFQQAVFFASRLQFERARGGIEALNNMGLPAALLDPRGEMLFSNGLFDVVEHYFVKGATGRLTLRGYGGVSKAFAKALETSMLKSSTLALPSDGLRNPAVIHLIPLYGEARSVFSISGAVMVVSPVALTAGVPSSDLVSALFNLSRAEARLAVSLASGLSLRDSAAKQSIGVGTARAYLHAIFNKTSTSQQSELVSLVKGVGPVGR